MKKAILLNLIGIIVFTIVIVVSCNRKDVSNLNLTDNSTKELLIKYLNEQQKIDISSNSFIDTLISKSDWSNISQNSISSGETIIYVPFKFNSNNTGVVFFYNKFTNKIDLSYISELINKNTPNSISHSTSVSLSRPIDVISSFYKYNLNGYSGSIRAFSLSNNFLWEYGYDNGNKLFEKKITNSLYSTPPNSSSEIKSNSLGANSIKVNSCIDWYLVTYYPNNVQVWVFVGTSCNDCSQSIGITQDSLRIKSNCNSSGGAGGSNQMSSIIINLTDPCLKKLVQKLSAPGGLNNEISDILQNVFNKNSTVNITFVQDNTLNDGQGHADFGQTTIINNNSNNIQVSLNPNALINSSMEFKTQVIMHEILHGYLENYFNEQGTNNTNNSAILGKYVQKMAKSLKVLYPQMSPDACLSLSLKGLEDLHPQFETVINGFGLTSDNTKSNGWWVAGSLYYDLGSDFGTPCTTTSSSNPKN
jgi:hypothetical protein